MDKSRLLRYTGIGLLLAVLAAGPLLRGLFFWTELLAAIAAVTLGAGLWLLGRRLGGLPAGLPGGGAGVALLTLLGLYLLQFGWAVYPRGNLDWVLRVAAACFAYIMLRAEAGPGLRRWVGWVFVASAALVALVGFLEYTGYLLRDPDLAKTLSLVGLNARMFTTFQYPNTAAAYFLAAMLAAAGLALEDLRAWKLSLAGALMTFLLLAFFFTVSRGAVVVLPFGLLLLFLGLQGNRRWAALLLLLAATAPMVVAMGKVGLFSAAHNYISAGKWITAAALGGALAGLVLAYFLKLKPKLQLALAAGALVLAAGGLSLFRPAGGLLPKQATRLLDMNFRTVNVVLRLRYDQDALRMAAARPLGRGGWGWDRGYRQVQPFNYTARETHDQFAQTAVEAGIPGLLALLAALGAALWAAWQNRRANPLGWTLAAAAALIAAHSAIDFDLSYGAMWLLLWALLGAAAGPAPVAAAPAAARAQRIALPVAAVVALIAAGLAGVLAVGSHFTDRAADLAGSNPTAAAAAARQGARYDPWYSEPLRLIGDLPSLERAARLDPYHSGIRFNLAIAKELQRDFTGALTEAQAALADQPQVSMYYTKVAALAGNQMVDALHNGDRATARQLAAELKQLGADFSERKRISDPLQSLWAAGPKLTMSADFQLRYGQALFLTGDAAAAEPLLKAASKVGLLGSEADVWLYVLAEKRHDTKAMAALADKPWIRFRNVNPVYKLIGEWQ